MPKFVGPGLTAGRPAGIFPNLLDQALSRALERRRSSRHAARRRQRLDRTFIWAGAVFVALAFAGGFVWRNGWWSGLFAAPLPQPAASSSQAEALRFFDEAVRSRYEERAQGAVNALSAARGLEPNLPGLDLFVGEVAWEQRDFTTLRRAAAESLRRGHNESAAGVLLALEKWATRNPADAVSTGSTVLELLAEASAAQPSAAAAFFFSGEVSRLLGDVSAAHRHLLSGLYRQAPWASSSVLATKVQLAAAEAQEAERSSIVPAPDAQALAVLELRDALRAGREAEVELKNVISSTPITQARILLADPAFASGAQQQDWVWSVYERLDPLVPLRQTRDLGIRRN